MRIQTQTWLIPRPTALNHFSLMVVQRAVHHYGLVWKGGRFTENVRAFEGWSRNYWKRNGDSRFWWRKIFWVDKLCFFTKYHPWVYFLSCQPDLSSLRWGSWNTHHLGCCEGQKHSLSLHKSPGSWFLLFYFIFYFFVIIYMHNTHIYIMEV